MLASRFDNDSDVSKVNPESLYYISIARFQIRDLVKYMISIIGKNKYVST